MSCHMFDEQILLQILREEVSNIPFAWAPERTDLTNFLQFSSGYTRRAWNPDLTASHMILLHLVSFAQAVHASECDWKLAAACLLSGLFFNKQARSFYSTDMHHSLPGLINNKGPHPFLWCACSPFSSRRTLCLSALLRATGRPVRCSRRRCAPI